jgi:MFS transporter, DHA2 family, lincomycin resistance protein
VTTDDLAIHDASVREAAPLDEPRTSSEPTPAGGRLVLGLLMFSTFLVLLNEMLLGVALPTLVTDLDITPTTGQWVTTGYLLVLAVLIPATGFVMRRYHLRSIFLTAMSLFILGTAIAAWAPTIELLLVGRVVQAVGTAVFMPLLMTTTMRLVPVARRGQTMALVTAITAIAPAVGPGISGLVLSQLSWRWLFILVLPLAVLALAVGMLMLPNITTPEAVTLDVLSLGLSAVGFGSLVYGLSSIGESVSGHTPLPPYLPIAVGVVGIALFGYRQIRIRRSGGEPFLDMRIFARKYFTVPLLVMVLIPICGFGTLIVMPLVLTNMLGLRTLEIGLFLVPGGVAISVVSALGGRVYDRVGPRPLIIPGAIAWVASLWVLSQIDETTHVATVLAAYLVMSGAQAMMWAPLTTSALSSLHSDLYPHGSAAFTTVQQLAGAAGGAILISAYTIGANATEPGLLSVTQSASAAQAAYTTAAAISIASIVGVLFVRQVGSQREVLERPAERKGGSDLRHPTHLCATVVIRWRHRARVGRCCRREARPR